MLVNLPVKPGSSSFTTEVFLKNQSLVSSFHCKSSSHVNMFPFRPWCCLQITVARQLIEGVFVLFFYLFPPSLVKFISNCKIFMKIQSKGPSCSGNTHRKKLYMLRLGPGSAAAASNPAKHLMKTAIRMSEKSCHMEIEKRIYFVLQMCL